MAVWVARGEHAAGAVEQRQAVREFMVDVMTPRRSHGARVPVTAVHAAIDAAGPLQRGVLQDMAVHLGRLVQVARWVVLCGREWGSWSQRMLRCTADHTQSAEAGVEVLFPLTPEGHSYTEITDVMDTPS